MDNYSDLCIDIQVSSDNKKDKDWLVAELEEEHEILSVGTKDGFTYLEMILRRKKNGTTQIHWYNVELISKYEDNQDI